jgi:hypothetical protein
VRSSVGIALTLLEQTGVELMQKPGLTALPQSIYLPPSAIQGIGKRV